MKKESTTDQIKEPQERKLFSMMTIPFIILIINGIDIVNEFFNNSDYAVRAIDIFMLVMAVISLVLVAINTVKYLKEKKDTEAK